MIKKTGDLFQTEQVCIAQGVNVDGMMGAGIAKEFRRRFPENYSLYRQICRNTQFPLLPGESIHYEESGKIVFSLASQDRPGPNAKYKWLTSSCRAAAEWAVRNGHNTIAIPLIGCGIGGLDWNTVEVFLLSIEHDLPGFEWEVWRL